MTDHTDAVTRFIAKQRAELYAMPIGDSLLIDGILEELEAAVTGEPVFDPAVPTERLGRVVVEVYADLDSVKADVRDGISLIEVLDRARDAISAQIVEL